MPSTTPVDGTECQSITIYGDDIREGDETFTVRVTTVNSNDILTGSDITITILNGGDGKHVCIKV